MLSRVSIYAAYFLFILNLGEIFDFEAVNILEKGAFLLAAVTLLLTRPYKVSIVYLMIGSIALVSVLGAMTDYPEYSWKLFIFSLNQIIIVYALLAFRPTRKDRLAFLFTAAFIPLGSAVLGLLYDFLGVHPAFQTEFGTGVARFQGSLIPAYLSGLAMCGVFAATQLAVLYQRRRALAYGLCVANVAILLLAGGRAAMAVTLLVCTVSFYSKSSLSFRAKSNATMAGVAVMVIMGIAFGQTVLARFQTSTDNGRLLMWDYLQTLVASYPLTGIGFGHQYWAVPRDISVIVGSSAAHNDYYRLLVEIGYVGMPLFYILLTAAVWKAWTRERKRDLSVLVAYGGLLLLSWSDNVLATSAYYPLIIIAVMSVSHCETGRSGAPFRRVKRPAPAIMPHSTVIAGRED